MSISHYFKKRMEKEMKKNSQTENAFQQMRACAGNSDVKEMVMKFLTRDQTYASLLQSVSENEKKYEILK
jgi:predicted metallo-beta-lactamase superfamily hydrolase